MVGTGRFELPTPRTPSECSTRLSHVPKISGLGGFHSRRKSVGEYSQKNQATTPQGQQSVYRSKVRFPHVRFLRPAPSRWSPASAKMAWGRSCHTMRYLSPLAAERVGGKRSTR